MMGTLHSYKDTKHQCWANVRMANNDPVWISVAQTGVVIKKSRLGLFGPKLFVSRDLSQLASVCMALEDELIDTALPSDCDLTHPVLSLFVKACLNCDSVSEFCAFMSSLEID